MKYLFAFIFICGSACGQPIEDRGRVYRSVDNGINWTRADLGLPNAATINAWTTMDRIVIAGTDKHGLFISSDRMQSWHSSSRGLPRNVRILSIAHAENMLFVGTYLHGLFYSDDHGNSWHSTSKGLDNANIRVLHYCGGVVFAGTDNGLYVSHDAGASWTSALNGIQINSISSEMHELFVATSRGVLRTNNIGMTWSSIYHDGAIFSITSAFEEIYMQDFFGKVYKASKENYVWLQADLFLPFFYTFRITPYGSQFFTSDWNKILRGINSATEVYWSNGIPHDTPITNLLDTPFGLLASVGNGGGC